MKKPRVRDMAWLAGLYEGEGSCSIVRRYSRRPAARIHLASTDLDVVERAREIAGMGTISKYVRKNPKYRPLYCWEVSRREYVTILIRWLLPYAGERRRARLEQAHEIMTSPMPCKAGRHVLTERNTGRWKDGSVKCLGCERDRRKKKVRR